MLHYVHWLVAKPKQLAITGLKYLYRALLRGTAELCDILCGIITMRYIFRVHYTVIGSIIYVNILIGAALRCEMTVSTAMQQTQIVQHCVKSH